MERKEHDNLFFLAYALCLFKAHTLLLFLLLGWRKMKRLLGPQHVPNGVLSFKSTWSQFTFENPQKTSTWNKLIQLALLSNNCLFEHKPSIPWIDIMMILKTIISEVEESLTHSLTFQILGSPEDSKSSFQGNICFQEYSIQWHNKQNSLYRVVWLWSVL